MMTKPKISIVVAIAKADRGIGHGPELLFRISDDLKRFKGLTTGHPIIMGRKTFESIGRPLPGRTTIVVTRNQTWSAPGTEIAHSLNEGIRMAAAAPGSESVFIIGGGELYKEALEAGVVDCLELTSIDAQPQKTATVFFPPYETLFTKEIFRENRTDTATGIPYSWITLEK